MAAARPDNFATTWNTSDVGTTAGVSVNKAAVAGKTQFLTDLQASGDAAALVTVESPAGTVLWRKRFAAAFNFSERFTVPVKGAIDQLLRIKISASTANCEANGQGYQAP